MGCCESKPSDARPTRVQAPARASRENNALPETQGPSEPSPTAARVVPMQIAKPYPAAKFWKSGKSVYPEEVEDVPAAVAALTHSYQGGFTVSNRDEGHEHHVADTPTLHLSYLRKITRYGDFLVVEAGVTTKQLLEKLAEPELKGKMKLNATLHADSVRPVIETITDSESTRLRATVAEAHVVIENSIERVSLEQRKPGAVGVLVAVVLTLTKVKEGKQPPVAEWYTLAPGTTDVGIVKLPKSARVIIGKMGMVCSMPVMTIRVDGSDVKPEFSNKEAWVTRQSADELELSNHKSELFNLLGAATLKLTQTVDADLDSTTYSSLLKGITGLEQYVVFKVDGRKVHVFYNDPETLRAEGIESLFPDPEAGQPINPATEANHGKLLQTLNLMKAQDLPKATVSPTIPSFKGDVFDQLHPMYAKKRFQYATSSYEKQMFPKFVAYPEDEDDVAAAIKYAKSEGLKVMARSGGHQYCGVSCDSGSLILSMDLFNNVQVNDIDMVVDGKHVTKEAVVGVGNRLLPTATKFNKAGITVPHGECPEVGIGGHSQTGGYGHLSRSFGLCLDFVYQFTIVTADGEIRKPSRDSTDETDRNLYWAVCGGSPGAFGVTTQLVFHPIVDADYPKSTGFRMMYKYSKDMMKTALSILADLSDRCLEGDENQAPVMDYCISMTNHANSLVPFSAILVEMVVKDKDDKKAYDFFESTIEKVNKHESWLDWASPNWLKSTLDGRGKHVPLSELSLGFVRRPPAVTEEGRENPNPYDKACYGTAGKLKGDFVDSFANLLHDLYKDKTQNSVVFQSVLGGGHYQLNGRDNKSAIAHRDNRLMVVFDLFRPALTKSIVASTEYQRRFVTEVVDPCLQAEPKIMMQWASHGDLDMSNRSVWLKYFDKESTYDRLREIKAAVDPTDLFHSRFTVPPQE